MNPNNHLSPKYKHMLPGDIVLWERFLRRYGEYWTRFEYDVHVGRADEQVGPQPENIRRVAVEVMLKRIDAVGYRESAVWIFEVKPNAALSALGQLLGYKLLWLRDKGSPASLRLAVVSDRITPDDEYLFRSYAIRPFLV